MRSPIDYEKRPSLEDLIPLRASSENSTSYAHDAAPVAPPPPYTVFTSARKNFILAVTAAGFFDPLCRAVYLPSLLLFQDVFKLLKYPPHLIVSFNGMFQFTGLYAIYITFPEVWQKEYGWSTQEVGYAYLVPGISLFIASIVVGRVSDAIRKRQIAKSADGKISPERRIAIQIFGFVIGTASKLMYGWFIQNHVHPVGILAGAVLAAVGTSVIFVTSTSFQTECDPTRTASLVALGGFLRNSAAAVGTVTMDDIIRSMKIGLAFTGFCILDRLCILGIILIIVKGKQFRERL